MLLAPIDKLDAPPQMAGAIRQPCWCESDNKFMKIVLAHPGVGPFVQQTARALFEAGLLASYWTTFADRPEARWRQALVRLASLIGANLEQELGRRAVQEVPASLLHTAPFLEIIRSLLTKMRADPRIVDLVWEREILSFDRGVAKRGLENATGVYGYEYSALASFQEAEKRGLARIYEVPSPEHDFAENLNSARNRTVPRT